MDESVPIIESLPSVERLAGLLVTDEERCRAGEFGSQHRRAEYLAWRSIVRRELGADTEIYYSENGAPRLRNRKEHIGVSHSADFVAVIISDKPCAVDIERLSRNFSGAASRYITAAERGLSDDRRLEAVLWCAKETLYKYSGRQGLDFLRDLCIELVDFESGIVVGRICNGDSVEMRMALHGDNIVVWVG